MRKVICVVQVTNTSLGIICISKLTFRFLMQFLTYVFLNNRLKHSKAWWILQIYRTLFLASHLNFPAFSRLWAKTIQMKYLWETQNYYTPQRIKENKGETVLESKLLSLISIVSLHEIRWTMIWVWFFASCYFTMNFLNSCYFKFTVS